MDEHIQLVITEDSMPFQSLVNTRGENRDLRGMIDLSKQNKADTPVIDVSNLSITYHVKKNEEQNFWRSAHSFFHPEYRNIAALKSINFQVNQGDILGYVGENGAGKSTTIKTLLGIIKPTDGDVRVLGLDPFTHRKTNAPKIAALMGQKSQLWWELPLIDSFRFLQKMYGMTGKVEDRWLEYMLDKLNMSSFINQSVRELSLGQRMRGEFVATFLHHPQLVFLDEPTLGLDVITRQRVLDFLLEINKEERTTIVFTSHEMSDIEKVANRLLLLDHGEISYRGDVQEFVNQYQNLSDIEAEGLIKESEISNPAFKVYRRNKASLELLLDKTKLSEKEAIALLGQMDGVIGVKVLPVNLETILAIRGGRV